MFKMEKMNRPLQKQFKDFPQGQRADRSMR